MAKKSGKQGPSASQVIRDYCSANPDQGPKVVAEALKAQGYENVSPGYVSTIKSLAKSKGKKKQKKAGKIGRPKAAANESKSAALSLDTLLQAKKLAAQMGGVAKAQAALEALAKLGA